MIFLPAYLLASGGGDGRLCSIDKFCFLNWWAFFCALPMGVEPPAGAHENVARTTAP